MKKNCKCKITKFFPTLKKLKKELFIDLEKQEITRLSTGNKLAFRLIGKENKKYYAIHFCVNYKSHNLLVHRLFFYWHNGYLPKLVDHKDTNRLNNDIKNLRELDKFGNSRNSNKRKNKNGKPCSSKYKGVYLRKDGKYETTLKVKHKKFYLGLYKNEDNAGQAYNDKIRELGLEEVSVLNDTPQERVTKNNQFDPLPQEMNHIKVLFQDIEPLVDLK